MSALNVFTEGDGCWSDLAQKAANGQLVHVNGTGGIGLARLPRGMVSGKSSVTIRIDHPDGQVTIGEVSMAHFLLAADMFRAAEERGAGVPA